MALWQRELALRRAELAEAELALAELEQELPKEDETGTDDEVEALEVEVP